MKLTRFSNVFLTGFTSIAVLVAMGAYAPAANNNGNNVRAKSKTESSEAIAAARGLSAAFRSVSNQLLPSVVAIENKPKPVKVAQQPQPKSNASPFGDQNPFKGSPFEEFFKGRNFQMPPGAQGRPPRRAGIGSGVIVDDSGIILTNNHVVEGDGEVKVRLHDGREFIATKVSTDPETDIAVVQIQADGLIAAPLGNSDGIYVGDWVLALGQPFGLESTVTAGIISGKHRGIGITDRENFLQTDAAINPGNSGGPLVNLDGEIVGINTAISSRSGGNEGIGFAVPINLAKWVADQLIDTGDVKRAYLGVGIQPVTHDLAMQLGVEPRQGVVVTDVYPDTPAAKTGLQSGDVIVEFAGKSVDSPRKLQLVIERAKFGVDHSLTVVRGDKEIELTFTPKVQPDSFGNKGLNQPGSTPAKPSSKLKQLGLEISALTEDVGKQLGLKNVSGVVVTDVQPGSPAAESGLKTGMVITQVNRQSVATTEDVNLLLESSDDGVLLLVRTERGSRFVVIKE